MGLRLLTALLVCLTLLSGSVVSGGSVDENSPDAADWQSFSDEKVLEYLDNPFSNVRLYAGQEILRRWDEKKIIALCEKNWRRGEEVLASGEWPGGGRDLEVYLLLPRAAGRDGEAQEASNAAVLARRGRVPMGAAFDGRVGGLVRDEWFTAWIARVPPYVFFVGVVDFLCQNSWARDRFYRDDGWVSSWGSYRRDDGTWWHPWRLVEYRHVVAILCGDMAHVDQSHVNTNQFLQVLQKCVESGKNHADVPMTAGEPASLTDRLTSTMSISGVGAITYAELVAVVMNRADWIPAIHKRLEKTEQIMLRPKFKDNVLVEVEKIVTHYDARSPLVAMMSDVGDRRWDAAKAGLKAYWRREWRGYSDTGFSDALWRRHPWLARGFLDKQFSAWYADANKPFVGDPDVAFLRGEWQ